MKLSDLLEIEYGSQNLLQTYQDQIKEIDPEQYRKLQLMMSQQQDNEVAKWITNALESGKLEHIDDAPPNDKAIPLSLDTTSYEVDALSEDEEYCPVCAKKLKEIIRKSIDECWKTHKQVGMKKKGGKTVPNCVPKNEEVDEALTHPRQLKPAKEEMYEEIDALHENEEYCPKCATKIKEAIKEEIEKVAKEAKTKPAKGKRFAKKVKNKKTGRTRTVSYGQAGKAKKGGDRIRPGTAKGNAYCARSAKIKKCKNPPCANTLSRKKWKCQGSRSVK
jgi:uncharacterized protein with PIN domain